MSWSRTERPTEEPGSRWAMFSALRYPNFRLYWIGQLTSVLAQNMQHVALYWLVLVLTDSPLMIAMTGLSHAIPTIAFTFIGGVVADRTDRKKLLAGCAVSAGSPLFRHRGLSGDRPYRGVAHPGLRFPYRHREGLRPASRQANAPAPHRAQGLGVRGGHQRDGMAALPAHGPRHHRRAHCHLRRGGGLLCRRLRLSHLSGPALLHQAGRAPHPSWERRACFRRLWKAAFHPPQ